MGCIPGPDPCLAWRSLSGRDPCSLASTPRGKPYSSSSSARKGRSAPAGTGSERRRANPGLALPPAVLPPLYLVALDQSLVLAPQGLDPLVEFGVFLLFRLQVHGGRLQSERAGRGKERAQTSEVKAGRPAEETLTGVWLAGGEGGPVQADGPPHPEAPGRPR